ncbi:hypothetical protein SAMN05216456_1597 [Devosia crocina]|uniref:Uncharacterized protein n=2 Tax=Devosia crocina TaxID=429728 RepID=A0A1I7NCC1_9HYPH|nr:hypothetical protein SAMN05216456_1597 [Devosia crocina]
MHALHSTPAGGVTLDMLTTTELLEANKTLLAVRQILNLQATRFRAFSGAGGEQVRAWATQHLQRMDEEIFAIAMEFDNREMANEDEEVERDIAIRESYDVLPFENPFGVKVSRSAGQ